MFLSFKNHLGKKASFNVFRTLHEDSFRNNSTQLKKREKRKEELCRRRRTLYTNLLKKFDVFRKLFCEIFVLLLSSVCLLQCYTVMLQILSNKIKLPNIASA